MLKKYGSTSQAFKPSGQEVICSRLTHSMTPERISVFDIFKIGIGPSSSHTLGPWRAAQQFLGFVKEKGLLQDVQQVTVHLYGSLAKTGRGHGTDIAVILGLSGYDPVTIETSSIDRILADIAASETIRLHGEMQIHFNPKTDVVFHKTESLPFHPNGVAFAATCRDGQVLEETYYSIGGGFVIQEGREAAGGASPLELPYPVDQASDLLEWHRVTGKPIWEIVLENERVWKEDAAIRKDLLHIWQVMQDSIFLGCQHKGVLPGGLNVKRRAADLNQKLLKGHSCAGCEEWIGLIRSNGAGFNYTLDWVSCFALAVNEQNASYSRVVTAPTNGAAGVIPAVLQFHVTFCGGTEEDIFRFLLTAGEIGSILKKVPRSQRQWEAARQKSACRRRWRRRAWRRFPRNSRAVPDGCRNRDGAPFRAYLRSGGWSGTNSVYRA
jgi:L-serine dehydratase